MSEAAPTLTAERLFRRYFLPLYPPKVRDNLAAARTTDANPANNPRILQQLDSIATTFVAMAPRALGDSTLQLDFSDASIHRLATCLTRATRDRLITPIDSAGQVPPLVHVVTHGAVYLGACVVRQHGGQWQLRSPLWESLVRLESAAGIANLALFQWWLKAFSDDEIDQPMLGDRYRMHIEVPTANPRALPIIAAPDRKLPRLSKVRYDTLHKYLRAQLPELRGVGAHFPSPERFAELDFQWLDFMLLGEGRMLLMHGPASNGVHLFWLDAAGFRVSAYYPADAFPAHVIKVDGEKLQINVPILGQHQLHEVLWWGP
ncbi:MAG TPA: hypothetical protein ENK23_08270 [Sorangium sp.]|nr:hypothetical protein [Sorangium sp.]